MNTIKTLIAFFAALASPLESQWIKCGQAIEDRNPLESVLHFLLVVLYIGGLSAAACGLVALACEFWFYLIIPILIVNEFIKMVIVHAPSKVNGRRFQAVQVVYNLVGEVTIPDTQNRETA